MESASVVDGTALGLVTGKKRFALCKSILTGKLTLIVSGHGSGVVFQLLNPPVG